jgi:hypothetical protein
VRFADLVTHQIRGLGWAIAITPTFSFTSTLSYLSELGGVLVGAAILVGLLRYLLRRPRISIGFLSMTGGKLEAPLPEIEVKPTWGSDGYSAPFEIHLACQNRGRVSAFDLLYNFTFPASFDFLLRKSPKEGKFTKHPINGRPMWTLQDAHLHSGDTSSFDTAIRVPKGVPTLDILAEVSMRDRPSRSRRLRLLVR